VQRWHEAVRDRPAVKGLSLDRLIDHIPDLLLAIADSGERRLDDPRARLSPESAEQHAVERSMEGLDLPQVVIELSILRDCILEVWDDQRAPGAARPEVRFLNRSIDRAMAASIERYTETRDRTARALDRISTAALESRRLDDLLGRLLGVLLDTTPSLDTGVVYLRDGDELVLRAAVGLEAEAAPGTRVTIGEGFAGRLAAERRQWMLSDADVDAPQVRSPVFPGKGLRCLFGMPLIDDGSLVGVAHVGSLTAPTLSDQDRMLFQAMVARATNGIVQHQLREAAERRAAELSVVVESIPDALLVGDHTAIRTANRAALELLGVDDLQELNAEAEALSSRFLVRRATGEDAPRDEQPYARALRGEQVRDDLAVRNLKTGEERILRAAAAPIKVGERVTGAVMVATDITEDRMHEGERKLLYEQAQQAVADREHALAVVSHDLRGPLNTIALSVATLSDVRADAALADKATAAIKRSVSRMTRLISDLLDFSSIQAGRFSCVPVPIDAAAVVEEAVEGVCAEAEARGLEVHANASRILVRADRDRLLQALGNVLGNSVKATVEGSISVSVSDWAGQALFAVVDTGPGVPPDLRERLFDPYWRAEDAAYKGTGLGLTITKAIVEAHGGRIWLESQPGQGAAFYFTIPKAV
jgi:PAS domain S-box-containing protein